MCVYIIIICNKKYKRIFFIIIIIIWMRAENLDIFIIIYICKERFSIGEF